MSRCHHVQTKVSIGNRLVFATGTQYLGRVKGYGWITSPSDGRDSLRSLDSVVGLDMRSWSRVLGIPSEAGEHAVGAYKAACLVNWPDFGVVDVEVLALTVDRIDEWSRESYVELGCIGAHGRTGTVLAALAMRWEGMSAGEALSYIRRTYCGHAVETMRQYQLLEDYEAYLEGRLTWWQRLVRRVKGWAGR